MPSDYLIVSGHIASGAVNSTNIASGVLGSVTIGRPITNGNIGAVLFVNSGGNLGQDFSGNFAYDPDGSTGPLGTGTTLYIGDVKNRVYFGAIALFDATNNVWYRISAENAFIAFLDSPGGFAKGVLFSGGCSGDILNLNSQTTTVNGSVSGSAVFSQAMAGGTLKRVMIYCLALVGTAVYTFSTAFSFTPVVATTNGLSASLVTAISTSAVTVTGSNSTGFLILEGY